MEASYDVAVWHQVEEQCGPVGELGRLWHAEAIAGFESASVPPRIAADIVADRISTSRGILEAGLAAYDGLVTAIEFAGEMAQPENGAITMPHLLTLKVKLARLYHYLAIMAPSADVDVTSPDETEQMVAESQAELEAWLAQHADEPDAS